jgi:hypothetical protein
LELAGSDISGHGGKSAIILAMKKAHGPAARELCDPGDLSFLAKQLGHGAPSFSGGA